MSRKKIPIRMTTLSGYRSPHHTIESYKNITKKLVGSIVKLDFSTPLFGASCLGCGIVLDHRLFNGEVHLRVGWIISPYINFSIERKLSWVSYERLFIVSKPKGDISNVDKNQSYKRKQAKG